MRRMSSLPPQSEQTSEVAAILDRAITRKLQNGNKGVGDLADDAGLPQRNILSMLRSGVSKIPFNRLRGIARALDIDEAYLLRTCLEEYQPGLNELLTEHRGEILTDQERELLRQWRSPHRHG